MIIAGRAIAGFGIGSVSLLVPVYIAETSPPSIRGRLVGIFEILSQYVYLILHMSSMLNTKQRRRHARLLDQLCR